MRCGGRPPRAGTGRSSRRPRATWEMMGACPPTARPRSSCGPTSSGRPTASSSC
ncbi:hypothetical protein [Ornithinimicrobium kibberense]|uniref:hypothetical protein n=1 Tax=Ornithinimicrobium kibberense TaxID=282060 RepID=UPI0036174941